MLRFRDMKAVFLLAFLALGPALADPTPLVPTYPEAVTAPPASAARLRAIDRVVAQQPLSVDERARLCRDGT